MPIATSNDEEVAAHFLAGGCPPEPAQQQQEIGVEVDTKQDHEDGHDPLNIGRKTAEAVVLECRNRRYPPCRRP